MNFGLCGNGMERENLSMFFPVLIEYVDFFKNMTYIVVVTRDAEEDEIHGVW